MLQSCSPHRNSAHTACEIRTLHFLFGKFKTHLLGDLSVSPAAAAQTVEVGGCNHKPEVSQLSFLIQFLKVLGGKGRDGLWGWVVFFFLGFSANLNLFILCSVLCLGLPPKTVSQKLRDNFITTLRNFKKGSDSGGLFNLA